MRLAGDYKVFGAFLIYRKDRLWRSLNCARRRRARRQDDMKKEPDPFRIRISSEPVPSLFSKLWTFSYKHFSEGDALRKSTSCLQSGHFNGSYPKEERTAARHLLKSSRTVSQIQIFIYFCGEIKPPDVTRWIVSNICHLHDGCKADAGINKITSNVT